MYVLSSSSMSDHPSLASRLSKRGAGKWTNWSDLFTLHPDFFEKGYCGGPRLPIRNTQYAYNSRSHDQCDVNPHIRADTRITSSITVPNNILTVGHMTKFDIAT
jgi:hypothetical protein